MFFSTYVLTKKGPLAKVWLAAHWDKKLTKNEVKVIDLSQTVLQIVKPAVPIALRTSGELMLGVVRIYALKVRHVEKDAAEATQYLLRPKAITALASKGIEGGKVKEAAVTMDIIVNRAGIDQLAEADFTDIADILLPTGTKKAADEPAGGAWFEAQPSQFLEENAVPITQDDIFADFTKQLQDRRDPSATSSKTKSSLSSVEQARAAQDALGALDPVLGNHPMPDDEDLNILAPPIAGGDLEDPFAMGDLRASGQIPAEEPAMAPKRRLKVVSVLDTKDTTLSRDQLQKNQDSRHDILCAERRHGPLDETEAAARTFIRNAENLVMEGVPLANLPSSGLRAVFEAAMRSTVEKAVEEMEAARGQDRHESARNSKRLLAEEADEMNVPPMPEEDIMFEYPAEEAQRSPGKKTSREERDRQSKKQGFSASTVATLERLQATLTKTVNSVSFSAFMKGKKRGEVARSFVDILVLASHNRVEVAQRDAHGEIVLHKTDRMNDAIATA